MNQMAPQVELGQREISMRETFLAWQCRVRQIMMRNKEGRPDKSIAPLLTLSGEAEPLGSIVTVMCKLPPFSPVPEMQHMVRQTHDPALWREKAIRFLSSTFYQKAREFSETLTSTFAPGSPDAQAISDADNCTLVFEAYGQQYSLLCKATQLTGDDPLYQATWWHNLLFNPNLPPDTIIIGFEPDWAASSATPEFS